VSFRFSHAALPVALLAAACITNPYDGGRVQTPYEAVVFNGFAQASGATIVIEAFNWRTQKYDSLAAAVADTQKSELGGRTLYLWSSQAAIANTTLPGSVCRWAATCLATASKLQAVVRARELSQGGGTRLLFAVTLAAVKCMAPKVLAEKADLYLSYAQCMGEPFDAVRLGVK
jgi:hypothetical protein